MGQPATTRIVRIITPSECPPACGNVHHFYIGKNYTIYQDLAARGVQNVAGHFEEAIQKTHDFILNIDSALTSSPLAFLTATSCHNQYLSSLPMMAVRGHIMLGIARANNNVVFIVDSAHEASLYACFLNENGANAEHYSHAPSARHRLRQIRNFGRIFMRTLNYKYRSRPSRLAQLYSARKLFITWRDSSACSAEDLLHRNRYWGNIIATEPENSTALLGRYPSGTTAAKLRHEPIAMIYDAMTWGDIFRSFVRVLHIKSLRKLFLGDNETNYTALTRSALLDDHLSGQYFEALLDFFMFLRLQKYLNPHTAVFYPFENQPWEKALIYAMKSEGHTLTGFQFFPFPKNLGMHCFSLLEKKEERIPNNILATDHSTYELFIKNKASVTVTLIPSQRYKDFPIVAIKRKRLLSRTIVLASLFLQAEEAIELTCKACALTEKIECDLWINFHPLTSDHTKQAVEDIVHPYPHVTICPEPFSSLQPKVDAVLYNQSSVVYDAALSGLPVFFFKSSLQPDMNRFKGKIHYLDDDMESAHLLRNILKSDEMYELYRMHIKNEAQDIFLPAAPISQQRQGSS